MVDEKEKVDEPVALDLKTFELEHLLGLCISLFSEKAWEYMGIRLSPGKKEVEKDLVKAAAAIDCVSVLVDKATPFLDKDDVDKLKSMIADLQLNYARQA